MNKNIFVSTSGAEDWRRLLADPRTQWRKGYSAASLAYCWEDAKDFPKEIRNLFQDSKHDRFKNIELLLALPEYKVPLPGGKTQSQNDIFALSKDADADLVSITIEGKVSEPFGQTMAEWYKDPSPGKKKRIKYLEDVLDMTSDFPEAIRYQLIHRTASALILARRFKAKSAVMIVHSFSQTNEWFEYYQAFTELFGAKPAISELAHCGKLRSIDLYCGWAKGNKKYLQAGSGISDEEIQRYLKKEKVDVFPGILSANWLQELRQIKQENNKEKLE